MRWIRVAVVAAIVLLVAALSFATIDARRTATDSKQRATRLETRVSANEKNVKTLSAAVLTAVARLDGRVTSLESVADTSSLGPTISDVQSALDDLRTCVDNGFFEFQDQLGASGRISTIPNC